jgi:hypothetical protein
MCPKCQPESPCSFGGFVFGLKEISFFTKHTAVFAKKRNAPPFSSALQSIFSFVRRQTFIGIFGFGIVFFDCVRYTGERQSIHFERQFSRLLLQKIAEARCPRQTQQ